MFQQLARQMSARGTTVRTQSARPVRLPWRQLKEIAFRKSRIQDGRLILCIVMSGLLIIMIGVALFVVGFFVIGKGSPVVQGTKSLQWMPFVGIVVVICGIIVALLSIEVCLHRKKAAQKSVGTDEDFFEYITATVRHAGGGTISDLSRPSTANKIVPLPTHPEVAEGWFGPEEDKMKQKLRSQESSISSNSDRKDVDSDENRTETTGPSSIKTTDAEDFLQTMMHDDK